LNLVLADLVRVRHSALVVEGRLSDLVRAGQQGAARPGWLLNLVAVLQVEHPGVAWMFAETGALAEDWAYRWLAASLRAERSAARATGDQAEPPEAKFGADSELARVTPRLLDPEARRAFILDEANTEVQWTTRLLAVRARTSQTTAWKDLTRLAAEGLLEAIDRGRESVYKVPGRRSRRLSGNQ
jgi:hypothetical protein